ncbi:MAG: peptidoglycan-binding protein, partial [Desulfobacterales bacterium]
MGNPLQKGKWAVWAAVVFLLWSEDSRGLSQEDGGRSIPMQDRIEAAVSGGRLDADGHPLLCRVSLPRFYENRGFEAAWIAGGAPSGDADDLLGVIRGAHREGLKPEEYHLTAIESILARSRQAPLSPEDRLDLELLLTDAFLLLGSHLLSGRINPETIDAEWFVAPRSGDMPALLEGALNTHRVRAVLMGFLPSHPGYEKLRRALYNYRSLAAAGGWEAVPEGPALKPGDAGERVIHLSRRLSADSALNLLTDAPGAVYDSDVEAAVREFQRRHGLEPDGVAGKATLSALNVPASQRVRQIEANLERWRWLPEDLGERYILVNVADYTL